MAAPDSPPPPRPEDVYAGEEISARRRSNDSLWMKPDSTERMVRVFKKVRDHDISYLRVVLEHIPRTVLEIDGSDREKPVRLDWNSQIVPGITWSDSVGVIGPGLILHHRNKPILMVQIGAAEVSMQDYQMLPNTWYLEKFVPSDERHGFVLTHRGYFLTYEGLKEFGDPDFIRTVQVDARIWYQVTFQCGEFAIQRLVARYL